MLTVSTDFDNGGGRVVAIDAAARRIALAPVEADGARPLFIHARLSGLDTTGPTRIEFVDVHPPARHARGVYSYDGCAWARFDEELEPGVYVQRFTQPEVFVARNLPYPYSASIALAEALSSCPAVTVDDLCTSEGGRPVKCLRFGSGAGDRAMVWVHARLHAFESHSSRVADGLARWLAAGDDRARALIERADVFVVPIVDVDGVCAGLSGKDRQPVDFNRDWCARPHWRAVRAIVARLDELTTKRPLTAAIDIHSPWFYEPHHWHTLEAIDRGVLGCFLDTFEQGVRARRDEPCWAARVSTGYLRGDMPTATCFAFERWLRGRRAGLAITMEVAHDRDSLGRWVTAEALDAYGQALGEALAAHVVRSIP